MCGICGKMDLKGGEISMDLLREMCRSFSYRGPDDQGFFRSPGIGLGHRRLSIIDLSPAGHQPMANEDRSLWIVYNGEVYDFERIRESLIIQGHILKSHTDAETILHLYEDKDVSCLQDLNGMFAFALWDSRIQRLWLVRDRLGIKPLLYYWDGIRLVFASEIKAILLDPDVSREIDPEALDLYLSLNYIPAPWTIFKHIYKLQPGHFLILEKGKLRIEPYWDISHGKAEDSARPQGDRLHQREEETERLASLLEASVRRHLIADVPVGAFLSGGIDSSIIVALMARNSPRPVKTFSIGYQDLPFFDETAHAREVARFYHTDHHEFKLGYRDILDAFPKVLENIDEPFADSSAIPTYIVSRETKQHVSVALSGDGGDELFAGYRMYLGEYWARYFAAIPRFLREGIIGPLVQGLPDARDKPRLERIRRFKKFLRGMGLSFPERFSRWREIFPFSLRQKMLLDPPGEDLHLRHIRVKALKAMGTFGDDLINLMLYLDVKGLLPGDMLTKVDRMSMANSLEVRVPFLDHTFVEYVFTLQGDLKLKATGGKYLLREAFKKWLPPAIRRRPKWGFEMPIGAWLRKELHFLIDEYLDEGLIRRQGLFEWGIIRALISDHMRERQDTSWQLWNLIVFQYWQKKFIAF